MQGVAPGSALTQGGQAASAGVSISGLVSLWQRISPSASPALGLPRADLSRRRAARLYGTGPLEHGFVLGRGMVSDDAEHACMTAQVLLAAGDDEAQFARSLA